MAEPTTPKTPPDPPQSETVDSIKTSVEASNPTKAPQAESITTMQKSIEDATSSNATQSEMPETSKTASPSEPALDASDDEQARLEALGATARDQDALENSINRQADELLVHQANERDRKRLKKTENEKKNLEFEIWRVNRSISNQRSTSSTAAVRLVTQLSEYEEKLRITNSDIEEIKDRIRDRDSGLQTGNGDSAGGTGRLPSETQREFLIRTGKITPFSKTNRGPARMTSDGLHTDLLDNQGDSDDEPIDGANADKFQSHQNLARPGFASSSSEHTPEPPEGGKPTKRRRLVRKSGLSSSTAASDADDFEKRGSADAVVTATDSDVDEYGSSDVAGKRKRVDEDESLTITKKEDLRTVDDGNEKMYQKRLKEWTDRRSAARRRAQGTDADTENGEMIEEWFLPHPTVPDKILGQGFRIPGDIFKALFDYQKVGVQWLYELYSQRVGGIVGDEMGLGKTIQAIAFIAGLHRSKMLDKPVIIAAPATLLKQWVKEFHTWWPALRVSILHSSGTGMMDVRREERDEEDLVSRAPGSGRTASSKQSKAAQKIVDRVVKDGHVLVTTYAGLQMYSDLLIPVQWGYAILDEGHTIRNPNTSITIHCKELRTPHRVILSGTPMQNNLTELWSLFDFVFPMRLGNLLDFKNSFEIPIKQGGYANASNQQIQIANKCAEALKDAISPYLLQRNKVDVAADLPKKQEQVLFCSLTKDQRAAYQAYLNSNDVSSIMEGRRQVLAGIDILRKICNHPDLQDHKVLSVKAGYPYGKGSRSGKMMVVRELLKGWKKAGHKTLLFSQHRIMLDILEAFVRQMGNINYRRMDGATPITSRQVMIDEFNNNDDIDLFLLTTKVGGLGTNLTSANRVIIYDPDWNPSTDLQARERAWRLGQKREVLIYRLMTRGTIEEKIYHRQIFKQFLSNKVLKDPKQRQTFQMQDLHDLFSLGEPGEIESETGKLFKGMEKHRDASEEASPITKDKGKGKEVAHEDDEVRNIRGIAKVEDVGDEEEEEDEDKEAAHGDAQNSESRIMSALFARSGVTSTFEHDEIINGKRKIAADPKMVAREAERVAAQAAAQLKQSEKVARAVQAGTVTWTGEFGSMGRPQDSQSRAGPASSRLLQDLQRRNKEATTKRVSEAAATLKKGSSPRGSRAGTPQQNTHEAKAARLLVEVRDYFVAQGGEVYGQMLIDHFNHKVRHSERLMQEFYAIVREIARQIGSGARGKWRLKPEFRVKKD